MSTFVEEVESEAPNRYDRVHPQAVFKVEHVIRKCLVPFPWIWVSVDSLN